MSIDKKLYCLLSLFFIVSKIAASQGVDSLLLKNYRPESIYKIPVTKLEKAKFPVIDMHSHEYGKTKQDIEKWVQLMDHFGIEKTVILSAATGKAFDSLYKLYSAFGNRFEVWCGFDYTGYNEPGWSEKAVMELERCYKAGAKGVGELGDKGYGEVFSTPVEAIGMHLNDVRLKPLFKRCGELKLLVNVHVAEPMWMYAPMDSTNDGLMNAYEWKIDKSRPKLLGHAALIQTLENIVQQNPTTTFIACHLANCEYDLNILGRLLDKYPNLYADIAARYAETAPIPRYMNIFCTRYQNKLLYGTDMGFNKNMYEFTFRVLQTSDEHFYAIDLTGYHWPLHGFGLSDAVLKKMYKTNAIKILSRKN